MIVYLKHRATAALTPSKLPCLGKTPTVNVTEGCAHGCCYCYARGYSQYPGQGRVVVYENLPDQIRNELRHKRTKPRRVYFSPSCDPFQPVPEVLAITLQAMTILLERNIEVAFLTKGAIPATFLDLFERHRSRVIARIGLTTLDAHIAGALEPRAATPARRLQNIDDLAATGIHCTARLDPLIPELTDRPESLETLLGALASRGVAHIAASYLFLRPAFAEPVLAALKTVAARKEVVDGWLWRKMTAGVGGAQMLDAADRRQRFVRLITQAKAHGIETHVCACKNPDIAFAEDCHIAGNLAPSPDFERSLFPDVPETYPKAFL